MNKQDNTQTLSRSKELMTSYNQHGPETVRSGYSERKISFYSHTERFIYGKAFYYSREPRHKKISRELFESLTAEHYAYASPYVYLAMISLYDEQNVDACLGYLEHALTIDPANIRALSLLLDIYERKGNKELCLKISTAILTHSRAIKRAQQYF